MLLLLCVWCACMVYLRCSVNDNWIGYLWLTLAYAHLTPDPGYYKGNRRHTP